MDELNGKIESRARPDSPTDRTASPTSSADSASSPITDFRDENSGPW